MEEYLRTLLGLLLSFAAAQYLLSLISTILLKKSPPGPIPLPIVGNLLTLRNKPVSYYANLTKTYGPLMSFRLGPTQVFVVSSASLAKEIFQRQDLTFTKRPALEVTRQHNDFSLLFSPVSDQWRTMRQVCHTMMLSGTSLQATEHIRTKQLGELISYIQDCYKTSTWVDIGQAVSNMAVNLLSNTFFSIDLVKHGSNTTCDHDIKQTVLQMNESISLLNLADYIPMLKVLDPQGLRRRWSANFQKFEGFINNMINERLQAKLNGAEEIIRNNADMLDALLKFSEENKDFPRLLITHVLLDLMMAGTDAMSLAIEWTMAELLRHPNILRNAQEELEQVIGKGNLIKEEDLGRLPYLDAVLKETLRLHPLLPFLPRCAVGPDVKLGGFKIPEYSQVWINVLAIGRDPDVWKNPDSFEPERFLEDTEINNERGKNFEFIPFGSGPRKCLGMPLVMRMVPLVLSCLVHFFDWNIQGNAGPENVDMRDKLGATLSKAEPLRIYPIIR